jgi:hypothetical protein
MAALSSAADYKTALFKVLSVSKNLDVNAWLRGSGMSEEHKNQIMSEYEAYRLAQPSRIHQTHKHDPGT